MMAPLAQFSISKARQLPLLCGACATQPCIREEETERGHNTAFPEPLFASGRHLQTKEWTRLKRRGKQGKEIDEHLRRSEEQKRTIASIILHEFACPCFNRTWIKFESGGKIESSRYINTTCLNYLVTSVSSGCSKDYSINKDVNDTDYDGEQSYRGLTITVLIRCKA